MKNVNYLINGSLAMAVLVLFILHFTGKNNLAPSSRAVMTSSEDQPLVLPVAYINLDSLFVKYHLSIDLNEQLTRKSENAHANFTQQARNFQAEVENFEFRYRNGSITTQQRVEQEQRRLQQRQEELRAYEERLTAELMQENQQLNEQLRDTIMAHLKEYNKTKGYQIIYSNSSASLVSPILMADEVYNITDEVVEFLNRRWSSPGGSN